MANLEFKTSENSTNEYRDDIDDDDDQVNSSHKVAPTVYKSNVSDANKQDTARTKINQSGFNAQTLVKNDLKTYVNTLVPKDHLDFVQCHVQRNKEGIKKGFTTTFALYFDGQNENDQSLLLTARKHLTIGGHSEYLIGMNVENPSNNLTEENAVAMLKGNNISGTEYVLYDYQNSSTNDQNKPQTAAIVYDDHLFTAKEPRKLTILLRDSDKNNGQLKNGETIIDQWRSGRSNGFIEVKNKSPLYNEESKTYTLNMHGSRVKQASHKNFQLITPDVDHENNVVMQFGRTDDNSFALDYRYPLTAIQAFAIALSAFHHRLRT